GFARVETMKAMLARGWGEPSTLEYADVPMPRPQAGEVVIDVRAIGCAFPDILLVRGTYQHRPQFPFSPGFEVAGVVRAVGAAGADVGIDYQTEAWVERVSRETHGQGANVVFDPVGGDVFEGSTRCIAFEGRLLLIGFTSGRIGEVAANRVLLKNISVVGVH